MSCFAIKESYYVMTLRMRDFIHLFQHTI